MKVETAQKYQEALSACFLFKGLREQNIRDLLITAEEQHFDGGMEHHGHFYCTDCGAVLDVPFDAADWQPPSPTGCRVARTEVVHYGLCKACQSKNI